MKLSPRYTPSGKATDMATDPSLGPEPPNQQRMLPRLYAGGKHLAMLREHHLDGTIPTYWGPDQDAPPETGGYLPPANWPRKGTLLRVPRVARWFWEASDIEIQVVVALGYTGTYSYGQHSLTQNVDATGPPGTIPVHIHTSTLDQNGVSAYGIPVTLSFSGTLATSEGDFVSNGDYGTWQYSAYLPPISLEEYEDRTSDTYLAIKELWDILSGGFTPFVPYTQDGFPPLNFTQIGPTSVGVCFPVKTGLYFINGVQYGTAVDLNTVGLTIPDGWAMPPLPGGDGKSESSNWGDLSDKMNAKYKGYTNPYFNAFPRTDGIADFMDIVTPSDDGFFACHTVNFILLSQSHTPYPSTGDARLVRIRQCYPNMATYVVVIMLDVQNLSEQEEAGDPTVGPWIDAITAVVDSMADCGWFMESVSYDDPEAAEAIMLRYIQTYLNPGLHDAPPDDRGGLQGEDDGIGDGD